jgi:hypothetical protein
MEILIPHKIVNLFEDVASDALRNQANNKTLPEDRIYLKIEETKPNKRGWMIDIDKDDFRELWSFIDYKLDCYVEWVSEACDPEYRREVVAEQRACVRFMNKLRSIKEAV